MIGRVDVDVMMRCAQGSVTATDSTSPVEAAAALEGAIAEVLG
jgi:hypothetical protein